MNLNSIKKEFSNFVSEQNNISVEISIRDLDYGEFVDYNVSIDFYKNNRLINAIDDQNFSNIKDARKRANKINETLSEFRLKNELFNCKINENVKIG